MKVNFDKKELEKIMKELIILIDTREKNFEGAIKYFENNNIKYELAGIRYGDYSAKLPKGIISGIDREIYFTDDIVIEKKGSIDELCENLKDKAPRLSKEFAHLNMYGTRFYVFIDDENFFDNLYTGNYKSKYNSKALRGSLKEILVRYGTQIVPIPEKYFYAEVYSTIHHEVKNILRNKFEIQGKY